MVVCSASCDFRASLVRASVVPSSSVRALVKAVVIDCGVSLSNPPMILGVIQSERGFSKRRGDDLDQTSTIP
jgi:hypothetical protein